MGARVTRNDGKSNLVFRKIPSLDFKYEINGNGTILRNIKSKRRIKLCKESHNSRTEYWKCRVYYRQKNVTRFVHNLVAECWLGPKPEGYQTDHIDQDSLNNDYRNLRYVTKSEQMKNRDYSSFQDKLLQNLAIRNDGKRVEVILISKNGNKEFSSTRQAAKFLAKQYPETKEKSFQNKLYHRRSHIFDYEVQYKEYYSECRGQKTDT